jgi:hypothetical protein
VDETAGGSEGPADRGGEPGGTVHLGAV